MSKRNFIPWDASTLDDDHSPETSHRRTTQDRREGRGFEPQEMVSWFHPIQMLRTAFQVVIAGAISHYIDRRDTQKVLPRAPRTPNPPCPDPDDAAQTNECGDADPCGDRKGPWPLDETFACRDDVWIDYIADLGDGWDPTYTTAMLLGRKNLSVKGISDDLPRAHILVFGGDNVYPTPSRKQYEDRLRGPYWMALPETEGRCEEPLLFAIPGNHDWYDGLTNFPFFFTRGRHFGAWRTCQSRSYFSVKLPGGWALWGNDVQLSNRIDPVQLDHFERVADKLGPPGEKPAGPRPPHTRVILCTARPSWLTGRDKDPWAYRNFWYFENRAVWAGCPPWVTLSGDIHVYARYSDNEQRQRIISGTGGSYLRGTHHLPKEARRPVGDEDFATHLHKGESTRTYTESDFPFPPRERSKRLALGALRFPLLPRNWLFCGMLGLILGFFIWTLRGACWLPGMRLQPNGNSQCQLPLPGLGSFLGDVWTVLSNSLVTWPLPIAFVGALVVFTAYSNEGSPRWTRWVWGWLHGIFQLVVALCATWVLAALWGLDDQVPRGLSHFLFYVALVVVLGFSSGLVMGIYLVISDRWLAWHDNEVFSAQGIKHYRSFVRMHVQKDGTLTLYPIGIQRVPKRWKTRLRRQRGQSVYEPAELEPQVRLIEGPIVIQGPGPHHDCGPSAS